MFYNVLLLNTPLVLIPDAISKQNIKALENRLLELESKLLAAPPIMLMYIQVIGKMLALPNGAAHTAPSLRSMASCGPGRRRKRWICR